MELYYVMDVAPSITFITTMKDVVLIVVAEVNIVYRVNTRTNVVVEIFLVTSFLEVLVVVIITIVTSFTFVVVVRSHIVVGVVTFLV